MLAFRPLSVELGRQGRQRMVTARGKHAALDPGNACPCIEERS